ncbi:MAG: hypothetical protein J5710_01225 [Treponema sp.]|nr:hypothetical protein [Treponema sp.]
MKFNRIKNARRNIIFGVLNKIVMLVFPFIIRMVMIRILGAEYLGLGSLFHSILHVLNITELGFSSAVVYSMYKPIAENDTDTLCAILNFYRKVYCCIGIIIAIIGGLLLPFLPKLINGEYPSDINIFILYLIYLSATVVSYILFAYKNSLISAYQRSDIISNINTIVHVFSYGIQLVILILTKNYYLYAIILVVAAIIQNIFTEISSRRLFPTIFCKGKLKIEIKNEIKEKVKGLFINKLCQVSRNSFDSIFVSAFLGLTQTAIYNNYYYIMSSVIAMLGIISPSILAGVGNSIVTETQQKNYSDMKKFNFIYMWLSGWCTVCLVCLYQPFTEMVFGKEMLFPFSVVVLFCVYFYALKMGDIRCVYSDAKGLWWENRYRAIIEAILNILLNFFLGKVWGIYGIIIATIISIFFINFIWGSTIIYKYYFTEIKISEYYLLHLLYALITLIACIVTGYLCYILPLERLLGFIVKIMICLVIPNLLFYLFYRRTSMYLEAKMILLNLRKH